ncbi:hypothetical protein GCM10020227_69830 [Streptomyces flavovirens]
MAAAAAGPVAATAPAPAAAASAAVRTDLREVGLVMGETPGRGRVWGCGTDRWANYRGSRTDPTSDSACAAEAILVCSTDVTCDCSGRVATRRGTDGRP